MYLIGMVAVLVRGWKEIGNVSYSARSYLVDLLSILFSISDLALLSSCQIETCLLLLKAIQNCCCNQRTLSRESSVISFSNKQASCSSVERTKLLLFAGYMFSKSGDPTPFFFL